MQDVRAGDEAMPLASQFPTVLAVMAHIAQNASEEQGMPTDTELWRAGSLMARDGAIRCVASVGILRSVEVTIEEAA
jgi:hypothetical protein